MTGFLIEAGRVTGIESTRGTIRAAKVALAVAGSTSRLTQMAGLRMPIESHVLQAFVSEAIKPMIPCVITFGGGHFYISQSDKGGLVFGGDLDGYNSYAQRGNLATVEDVCESGMALHFNLVWPRDSGVPPNPGLVEEIRECVYRTLVAEFQGSFSAEHGIGLYNQAIYERFTAPEELALAGALQRLIDADSVLGVVQFGSRAS